jgi:hypothetical protein
MIRSTLGVAILLALAICTALGGADGVAFLSGTRVDGSPIIAAAYVLAWLAAWTIAPIALGSVAAEWGWRTIVQRSVATSRSNPSRA